MAKAIPFYATITMAREQNAPGLFLCRKEAVSYKIVNIKPCYMRKEPCP